LSAPPRSFKNCNKGKLIVFKWNRGPPSPCVAPSPTQVRALCVIFNKKTLSIFESNKYNQGHCVNANIKTSLKKCTILVVMKNITLKNITLNYCSVEQNF